MGNDKYETFSDEVFEYGYGCKHFYIDYHNTAKFTWCYGDTVDFIVDCLRNRFEDLPWEEEFEYKDSYFLIGKELVATFYDKYYEPVYEVSFDRNSQWFDYKTLTFTVRIDRETSLNIFKQGLYYCGVKIKDQKDYPIQEYVTVLDPTEYCIDVI